MENYSTAVILATYNGTKMLKEQLDSLINQTKKIDCIYIRDDCSTDETYEYLKKYIKGHSQNKFRLIKNDINFGYEKNFFYLLNDVSEDLIFLCDQDDIWHKEKIEKCVWFFKEYQQAELLCTDNDFITIFKNIPKQIKNMKFDDSIEKLKLNKRNFHLR